VCVIRTRSSLIDVFVVIKYFLDMASLPLI